MFLEMSEEEKKPLKEVIENVRSQILEFECNITNLGIGFYSLINQLANFICFQNSIEVEIPDPMTEDEGLRRL